MKPRTPTLDALLISIMIVLVVILLLLPFFIEPSNLNKPTEDNEDTMILMPIGRGFFPIFIPGVMS